MATGVCYPGYGFSNGKAPRRKCQENGQWDNAVENPCTRLECPEACDEKTGTTWRAASSNSKVTGQCIKPCSSVHPPQRICNLNGTWGQILYNPCEV